MLNMTWEFKLKPTAEQVSEIEHILDVCRQVWNLALRERKDWLNSRKSAVNACSIRREFIVPADAPFPSYARQCKALTAAKAEFPRLKTVNAQVLQQVIRKLETSWESWGQDFLGSNNRIGCVALSSLRCLKTACLMRALSCQNWDGLRFGDREEYRNGLRWNRLESFAKHRVISSC